jgi:hypothetical protein
MPEKKKFRVLVCRTVFNVMEFEVTGQGEEEAKAVALRKASRTEWAEGNVEYSVENVGPIDDKEEFTRVRLIRALGKVVDRMTEAAKEKDGLEVMHGQDAKDYETIQQLVRKRKQKEAQRAYADLDTAARDYLFAKGISGDEDKDGAIAEYLGLRKI